METITITIAPHEAMAYAQFLKRAGHSDYRKLAKDDDEAYDMFMAGEKIRRSLAEKGYAPR
jgi:hypothetical protein